MIVIDERGHILSFSAAAERMFGYAEADWLGENVPSSLGGTALQFTLIDASGDADG